MLKAKIKNSLTRRSFITTSSAAAASILLSGKTRAGQPVEDTSRSFNLNYAPHFGMFKHSAGEDKIDQIKFMADEGFRAFEHNGMKDETVAMQEKIANALSDKKMEMGVFVAHKIYWKEPNLTSGDKDKREEFLKDIRESVEVAKRVNAKWMTVVPGHLDLGKDMGYQTTNVIDSLKAASEILEPHNLTMVLEPLNFRNHPGLFLTKAAQAYQVCKAVGSPSCKILFDIYHQQITEGNLIPNIEDTWDEVAYFQIGDNPGRKEPTTGEINYKNIFRFIHDRGFKGILGMEHGNSRKGKEGERAVIDAYLESDNFLS